MTSDNCLALPFVAALDGNDKIILSTLLSLLRLQRIYFMVGVINAQVICVYTQISNFY